MSWFGLADVAKNAISEAQKKIDKVLDIQEDDDVPVIQSQPGAPASNISTHNLSKSSSATPSPRSINKLSSKPKNSGLGVSLKRGNKLKKGGKLGTKVTPTRSQPTVTNINDTGNLDKLSLKITPNSSFNTASLVVPSNEIDDDTVAEDNILPQKQVDSQSKNDTNSNSECKSFSSPSTAASSEIDILDNESDTSEVSSVQSKFSEFSHQSPVLSQVNMQSDIELLPGSGYSSPPTVDDVKSFNDKMQDLIFDQSETPQKEDSANATDCSVDLPMSSSCDTVTDIDEKDVNFTEKEETEEAPLIEVNALTNVEENAVIIAKEESENATNVHADNNTKTTNEIDSDEYSLLKEKLESYEQKLFNLSKINAKLSEENDNFLSEISMMKEGSFRESATQIQELENSLFNMESKYLIVCEEKENLQKQKSLIEATLASRMTNEQVQQVLAEKEESIKGLLEEGEKLSKQHLQQNNLIKKLKSQFQEKESTLKSTKEKYENVLSERDKLQKELREVKNSDEEYKNTSMRISQAYEEREDEILQLQDKFMDSEEKATSLQNNLDSAYVEIADLNKKLAEKESQLNSQWENKEYDLKQQSEVEIKKVHVDFEHQKELLLLQIMDLNNTIQKNEIISSRKNDDLKLEIKDFQERLQNAEIRNQELMESVSHATSPLLRQMENLQTTFATQQRTWLALEKNLNGRLEEAQTQVAVYQERERIALTNLSELRAKFRAIETQYTTGKEAATEVQTVLKKTQAENDILKDQFQTTKSELEMMHSQHSRDIENLKKEKLSLENQLNVEMIKVENEQKKLRSQQDIWKKEKERMSWMNRHEMSTSISGPDAESVCSGKESNNILEHSSSDQGLIFGPSISFTDFRSSSSTAFENLQSQIKRHEGEIAQLHGEINRLERTRASMAEEIVRLTNENEDLEKSVKDLDEIKKTLNETETRYNTMLALYGEKEEENEELRMDLADIKSMYKQQINELLSPKS